ncbi:MAG TPA: extracellular solute-binding protein [Chloroflexota bacterium]|nr:extracellular solute-binding protein [Chloroflexota bacterium]
MTEQPRTSFSSLQAEKTPRRRFLQGVLSGAGILAASGLVAACSSQSAASPTAAPSGSAKAVAAPTTAPAANSSSAASAAKPTTAATPAAQAAPSGAGVSVQVRWNGLAKSANDYVKKFVADWNAKNTTKINADFSDWGSSFQKITTGIAGGIAPDVFCGGGLWTPVIASAGGAHALDSYVKTFKDWSDWYPVTQQDVVWNGKIYAIPYETGTMENTAYRKSIFEQKGIKNPPSTWDDAKSLAKELTVRDGDTWKVTGWDFMVNNTTMVQDYEDCIDQIGSHIFNADKTKPTNNTPEGEEALSFLVWFVENKIMPAAGLGPHIPNVSGWSTGIPAQGRMTYVDVQYAHDYAPKVLDDTIIAPPLKNVKRAQVLYVDKYMMFSKSKHPDEAWQVLEGITTTDFLVTVFGEGDWALPARKAAATAKFYQEPHIKVVVDNLQYAVPREAVPQSFDVQTTMSRIVESAIRGATPVKDALKQMDDEVTKIMKG